MVTEGALFFRRFSTSHLWRHQIAKKLGEEAVEVVIEGLLATKGAT